MYGEWPSAHVQCDIYHQVRSIKVEILSRCKGCAMGQEKLIDLLLSELTSTPACWLASSAQSLQA